MPEILAEMQGVNQKSNAVIVVIASTNKPWAIDSAFLRPGRFDEKIYIPLPDMQAREKLCELKLKNVPTQDLDYHQMAELTNGFNGADITEFCEKLKMYAIRESLASGKDHIINMEDVMKVSATVKSSVLEEDIENLKAFEDKFWQNVIYSWQSSSSNLSASRAMNSPFVGRSLRVKTWLPKMLLMVSILPRFQQTSIAWRMARSTLLGVVL